jgi:hypothetical protein
VSATLRGARITCFLIVCTNQTKEGRGWPGGLKASPLPVIHFRKRTISSVLCCHAASWMGHSHLCKTIRFPFFPTHEDCLSFINMNPSGIK